jgi:predicted thioesterase
VIARSELVATEDRKLTFQFTVAEGNETVAFGTHSRVVVDRSRFIG